MRRLGEAAVCLVLALAVHGAGLALLRGQGPALPPAPAVLVLRTVPAEARALVAEWDRAPRVARPAAGPVTPRETARAVLPGAEARVRRARLAAPVAGALEALPGVDRAAAPRPGRAAVPVPSGAHGGDSAPERPGPEPAVVRGPRAPSWPEPGL